MISTKPRGSSENRNQEVASARVPDIMRYHMVERWIIARIIPRGYPGEQVSRLPAQQQHPYGSTIVGSLRRWVSNRRYFPQAVKGCHSPAAVATGFKVSLSKVSRHGGSVTAQREPRAVHSLFWQNADQKNQDRDTIGMCRS